MAAVHDVSDHVTDVVGCVDFDSGVPGAVCEHPVARAGVVADTLGRQAARPGAPLERIRDNESVAKAIGAGNLLFGAVLGMYTGVLLSTLGARPLLGNSSPLWLLFLVSGLSSAAALVHMVASDVRERELLAKADNGFLILELFVIALFLIGLVTSSEVARQAAGLLLGERTQRYSGCSWWDWGSCCH